MWYNCLDTADDHVTEKLVDGGLKSVSDSSAVLYAREYWEEQKFKGEKNI
jgi:hypothetical protein